MATCKLIIKEQYMRLTDNKWQIGPRCRTARQKWPTIDKKRTAELCKLGRESVSTALPPAQLNAQATRASTWAPVAPAAGDSASAPIQTALPAASYLAWAAFASALFCCVRCYVGCCAYSVAGWGGSYAGRCADISIVRVLCGVPGDDYVSRVAGSEVSNVDAMISSSGDSLLRVYSTSRKGSSRCWRWASCTPAACSSRNLGSIGWFCCLQMIDGTIFCSCHAFVALLAVPP
ncbi:GL10267 [Drosophila persimilis]|uniref:GL10267 n=1 Tax=Drosophila persimilis TaxID=7234 RepID=B4HC48_DROPE|nr:GL10267 [Drosophila persimilis]